MNEEEIPTKSVKVVVLGDIGRSPRMQYHALSLANNGLKVNIIGYEESSPLPEIQQHNNIVITKLKPLVLFKGPKLLQYGLKTLWQSISLFLTLCVTGKSDYLLCQNPPAIPTLPVCKIYCFFTKTKFIIDWHNYAYSIMAMSLPSGHPLLKLSTKLEKYFGTTADNNLCVTYSMKADLLENWNITAKVLYDRPPRIFHSMSVLEKHDWYLKLGQQYPEFGQQDTEAGADNRTTAFTRQVGSTVEAKPDRPGLLFSSTSYTPDEDFGILLSALQVYETTYSITNALPKLICVITGKGPMKQHYIDEIAKRTWQNVKVITPWLEASDYPKMVGSADLGVCLHTSSSGLDLPMKVVDMFGAGLPVCAYEFKCLNELVQHGVNGYTFKNSNELAKQIITWFENFPNNERQNAIIEKMQNELIQFQKCRWEESWNLRVKNIFTE